MRNVYSVLGLCAFALAVLNAQPRQPPEGLDGSPVELTDLALRELSSLLQLADAMTLGEIKVRDVRDLLAEASVRMQEVELMREVKRLSWAMPGAGHFKAGDRGGAGAAYLASGIVVTVGTLVGAYLLLPEEIRFDHVNYLEDPYRDIKAAWEGRSLVDFLPSVGVLAGGFAVRAILSHFAAQGAMNAAARNIRDGKIRFQPYAAAERLGLEATWRM